jgi:hypothetical protein
MVALCKKIGTTKTKDALIKSLKQLATALENYPQDVDVLGRAKAELPRALWHLCGQQQTSDKDVKLHLAVCIVHMLRIWAPSTPYDDEPERLEVRGGGFLLRAQAAVLGVRLAKAGATRFPAKRNPRSLRVLRVAVGPPVWSRAMFELVITQKMQAGRGSRPGRGVLPDAVERQRSRTTTTQPPSPSLPKPIKQAALQVILWAVNRLQNHSAPTFQLVVSVLQVFCEVSRGRRPRFWLGPRVLPLRRLCIARMPP